MSAEFSGKRVVVMGLGRFGGGVGVTRWLCAQGAQVLVTDTAGEQDLAESLTKIDDAQITYRLGGHDASDLDGCDLLVVNPAVDKSRSTFVQTALRRRIPWTSEMNLFLGRCPGTIVGITGTVGKSTTTAMVGVILDAARATASRRHGRVRLGGNIGRSLLDELPAITRDDVAVLELSSFQLEDAAAIHKSPHIAVVTNFRENHLDRHGTIGAYAAAKGAIYKYQNADDWLVLPLGGGVERLPRGWEGRRLVCRFGIDETSERVLSKLPPESASPKSCGTGVSPVSTPPGRRCHKGFGTNSWLRRGDERPAVPLSLPGRHNLRNAAAALTVGRILDVPDAVAVGALARFSGLPHRLEFVREHEGVKYYNDSKATTPEAAGTALRAFDGGVVMMVGGSDKGTSFAELGRELAAGAKAVVCMGATGERIGRAVREAGAGQPPIKTAGSFPDAVRLARESADPGDVVLLSPACASFDWFRNYEERGDTFKRIVTGWR